jgi:hypothetical protein
LILVLLLIIANSQTAIVEFGGGEYSGEGGEWLGESGEGNEMLPPPSEEADNAEYRVFINGAYHEYGVPPEVTEDGVLLLPLYEILEADGASVSIEGTAVSIVTRKNKSIRLDLADGTCGGDVYRLVEKNDRLLVESSFFELELAGGLTFIKDIYTKTIIVTSDKATYGDVTPYSLGLGRLIDYEGTPYEHEVLYDIAGAMVVPQADKPVPIVVFLHGNHAFGKADETRYDLGFAYLMRALADKGYACFSLNIAMHYSFEDGEPEHTRQDRILAEHLTRLSKANEGEDAGFPFDLTGRLDLHNITYVGHSQGGGSGADLSAQIDEMGFKVNGIIEISPSIMNEPLPCPNVPVAIFLGLQDDDVIAFDGSPTFDALTRSAIGRTADTYMVMVRGANHAAFDEALIPQDRAYMKLPFIDPARQREFYTKFVIDFVDAANNGGSLGGLPNGADGDFYGFEALTAFYSGSGKDVLMAGKSAAPIGIGAEVIEIVGVDAPIPIMFDPDYAIEAGVKLAGNDDMPLYKITWTSDGAKVTIPIDETMKDFSASRALVIEAMQVSGESTSTRDIPVAVTLTDNEGQSASAAYEHSAALAWNQTTYVGEYYTRNIQSFLSCLTIPMERFEGGGLNMNSINEITLDFTGSDSGSVILRYIQQAPAETADAVPPRGN